MCVLGTGWVCGAMNMGWCVRGGVCGVCKGWCVWGGVKGMAGKRWCVGGVVHTGPCTWDRECTMVSSWAAISHCHQQGQCVLLLKQGGSLGASIPAPPSTVVAPASSHCHLPMDRIQRGVAWSHKSHRPWPCLGSRTLICWH